jgi:dienelactone hydrolase
VRLGVAAKCGHNRRTPLLCTGPVERAEALTLVDRFAWDARTRTIDLNRPAVIRSVLTLLVSLAALGPMSAARAESSPSPSALAALAASDVGAPGSGARAELFTPQGTGPFPAVVVLHGCDGVGPHYRHWARQLQSWGYVALLVDSFRPRGVDNVCNRGRLVPPETQADDAYEAADYLRTRADVVPSALGVIGFSHGGWAVLKAVLAGGENGHRPFAAAVAYYPGCETPASPLVTDTLILIGADDGWTPPDRCERWWRTVDKNGHTADLVVYPNSTHGFDTTIRLHDYMGHRVGGNPAAGADAQALTRRFFDERLRASNAP